jgi:hypothetical protein
LKINLIEILDRKRPFANFKARIESSSYRQIWFDFKDKKYIEYVIKQLEINNIKIE